MITEPYADIAEASALLLENAAWEDAEPEAQQLALQWAAVYMQSVYDVPVADSDQNPNPLIVANSLLAARHLENDLFATAAAKNPARGLSEKTVKAGEAGSTVKYDPRIAKQWIDPFPHITALLENAGYGVKAGNSVRTVALMR